MLGEMHLRIDELMFQHAGVRANSAKSWLLLQPGMVVPPNLPKDLQTTHDGLILVGAAIGTNDFIKEHVREHVDKLFLKLKVIF